MYSAVAQKSFPIAASKYMYNTIYGVVHLVAYNQILWRETYANGNRNETQ
jgi:hypothetical protein